MTSRQLKSQIEEYYKGTGYNQSDLQKYVISLCNNGYEQSYDGSLLVAYIGNLTVIVGCGTVNYLISKEI